jgi:XapX domain-containing protein
LLVGGVYSLLGVKSPAPPMIALIGLLGILLGEQVVPIAQRIMAGQPIGQSVASACAEPVLGRLPGDPAAKDAA